VTWTCVAALLYVNLARAHRSDPYAGMPAEHIRGSVPLPQMPDPERLQGVALASLAS